MQDYNYWGVGCMEVLIEISCCKFPPASELPAFWLQNKKALVDYLKFANTGVKGVVGFENGQQAVNVTVRVDQRDPYFKTNPNGEFYRILLPGTHTLELMLNCEAFYETKITVPHAAEPLVLNLTLPNSFYVTYKNASLNRYSVYCDWKPQ
jgi:hypothetical protein